MSSQHFATERLGTDTAEAVACQALLRGGSRSFHAASLLLPAALREPATGLYAFCRVADDAVDGGGDPVQALLELRGRLDRIYAGRPDNIPADRAFAEVVRRHGIPRELPEALLEGFAWDAEGRRYRNIGELRDYAARVAGSVGVMMSLIMGRRDPQVLARAGELGVAMQLTNIARDVGEDARNGRLYLPEDWLREAGIDPENWLAAPQFDPRLVGVVQRLLADAEDLYERAGAGIAWLPWRCRPGMHAARLLYRQIGHVVQEQGCDSVSSRAYVPLLGKMRCVAQALASSVQPRAALGGALAETGFLVDAVDPTLPPAAEPLSRVEWMFELFERLQREETAAGRGFG